MLRSGARSPGLPDPRTIRANGRNTTRHPVRPSEDHDDEDERDHDLPVEERIAQPRGEKADGDRPQDRAREARPPADRGPDDELRGQQESDRLGGDDALVGRVQRTGETRHPGAGRERQGLETAGPEAEELEPFFVLGDRGQQLSERRPLEVAERGSRDGQGRHDHVVEVLEGIDSGECGDPGHPVEAARHLDHRVRELKAEHREGEGDEGEVGAGADLPVEDEHPDRSREQGRNQTGAGEDGNQQPRVASERLEPRAGEIRPEPEEEGLAEREKAGAPPAERDALTDHSVEQVEAELVSGKARQEQRNEHEAEEDGEAGSHPLPAFAARASRRRQTPRGAISTVEPGLARSVLGARASRPQRAEGPRLFKRARCPRSQERRHKPCRSQVKPRWRAPPADASRSVSPAGR